MKGETIIKALREFFDDIIGSIIPGATLIVGCWLVLGKPTTVLKLPPESNTDWIQLILVSFIIGHAITSIGEALAGNALAWIRGHGKIEWVLSKLPIVRKIESRPEIEQKAASSSTFRDFVHVCQERYGWTEDPTSLHGWRSHALSVAQDRSHLVYRFMFLSQFNLGNATALLIALVAWWALLGARAAGATGLDKVPSSIPAQICMLMAILLLYERHARFFSITMRAPFSMALYTLGECAIAEKVDEAPEPSAGIVARTKIYLAGGFRSGWQDHVSTFKSFDYVDPRSHNLGEESQFTFCDFEAIRQSDWIFANLETTNPGGYNLALEVGFARALGKRVIVVDEKSSGSQAVSRQLSMLRSSADVYFESFQEAIAYLGTVERTLESATSEGQ